MHAMPKRPLSLAPLLILAFLGATRLPAQRLKLPVPLNQLEAAVLRDSTDPVAHYNVALGYWSEKRYDDAEAQLHQAVALDPRFAPAHLAIAYLPFARRPKLWDELFENRVPADQQPVLDASDREYRHAFLIDPLVDLRILGAVTPIKPSFLDVQDYWGEAWALFIQGFADCQEGRYDDCHGRFVTLIREIDGDRFPKRVPSSVLWYKSLAAAHIGKYDIAAQHLRELISREADFQKKQEDEGEIARVPLRTNEYRYTLATVLQLAGQTTDAVVLFQQALAQDVGLYMAQVRLAAIYEAQKDYAHAVEARARAMNANPDDASLVMDLGITLGKAGYFPDAETRLRQALEANPRDVRPLFWLGIACAQQGKVAEAREAFGQFVQRAPSRYDRQIAMAKDRLAQLH